MSAQPKPPQLPRTRDDCRSRHLPAQLPHPDRSRLPLPALYQTVFIPPAVCDEMLHERTPQAVQAWIACPPAWITVRSPSSALPDPSPLLGRGELEALSLALDVQPSFLIMDEVRGRQIAAHMNLPVIGILGVLKEASQRGFIDLDDALNRLQMTSFHAAPALIHRIRKS